MAENEKDLLGGQGRPTPGAGVSEQTINEWQSEFWDRKNKQKGEDARKRTNEPKKDDRRLPFFGRH